MRVHLDVAGHRIAVLVDVLVVPDVRGFSIYQFNHDGIADIGSDFGGVSCRIDRALRLEDLDSAFVLAHIGMDAGVDPVDDEVDDFRR